jgi:uncharacterized protein with von Willebrand factor type A (vWA) domain
LPENKIARKQKRGFALILFDTRAITFQYIKGKITPNDNGTTGHHLYGRWDKFSQPLSKAVDVISSSRFKEADLIFVTYVEASLSKGFLDKFAEQKVKKSST